MAASRLARATASAALAVSLGGATGCAWVSGLTDFERGACEGEATCADGGRAAIVDGPDGGTDATTSGTPQDAATPDGAAQVGDRDAEADGGVLGIDEPFSCGGAVCKSPRTCCGMRDSGAPTCEVRCEPPSLTITCIDDRACAAIGAVCCGADELSTGVIVALTCQARCHHPLCTTQNGSDTCGDAGVCTPTSPGAPSVCTPR